MEPTIVGSIHERLARIENALNLEQWTPPVPPEQLTIDRIVRVVCEEFGISETEIKSRQRVRPILTPRHVAIYLCRAITGHSFQTIAQRLGCRNHATALHACRKMREALRLDQFLAARVAAIEDTLGI